MTLSGQASLETLFSADLGSVEQRRRLLSWSQVSEWLRCRYRWEKRYQERLKPRRTARQLSLGSAVHLGISHAILTKEAERPLEDQLLIWEAQNNTNLTDEEALSFHDTVDTAGKIARRAIDFLQLSRWETIVYQGQPLCEQRVVVPLAGWDGYVAVFDWVARDLGTGFVWLIDHKTSKFLQPDDVEETNAQMASYQYALKTLGVNEVKGSIRFQIKASLPVIPKVNRDGTVSRAAASTDWPTYRETVLANGGNLMDYLDMQQKLADAEFFRLTKAYRSEQEVEAIWADVIQRTGREIKNQEREIIRALGSFACRNCDYKSLCLGDLRGEDVEFLRRTEFIGPDDEAPSLPIVIQFEDL